MSKKNVAAVIPVFNPEPGLKTLATSLLELYDTVLIVDDFLAKGNALLGLIDIVNQAGATLAGCSIAIEKGYQGGGDKLREQGIRVESMAIVDEMDDKTGKIAFRK